MKPFNIKLALLGEAVCFKGPVGTPHVLHYEMQDNRIVVTYTNASGAVNQTTTNLNGVNSGDTEYSLMME